MAFSIKGIKRERGFNNACLIERANTQKIFPTCSFDDGCVIPIEVLQCGYDSYLQTASVWIHYWTLWKVEIKLKWYSFFLTFLFFWSVAVYNVNHKIFQCIQLTGSAILCLLLTAFHKWGWRRTQAGTADSDTTATAEMEELQHLEVWRKG